jgi:hypothetical protein
MFVSLTRGGLGEYQRIWFDTGLSHICVVGSGLKFGHSKTSQTSDMGSIPIARSYNV